MNKMCVFCSILEGHLEGFRVYEDRNFFIILDKRPVFKGHCLIITKAHYENIEDLPSTLHANLFSLIQKTTKSVQKSLSVDGAFIAINHIVSQSVPHLHVHIIPRRHKDGLKGFFWPRTSYEHNDEMAHYAEAIKKEMMLLMDASM